MDDKRYNNEGKLEASEIADMLETPTSTPIFRRKFSWLRVAVLLIIAGAAMMAIGAALGGRGGGLFITNDGIQFVTNESVTSYANLTNTANISEITVLATNSSITVRPGRELRVRFENIEAEYTQNGTNLIIDSRRYETGAGVSTTFNFSFLGYYAPSRIIIEVPRNQLNDLNITTTSGQIRMDEITTGSLIAHTTNGGIRGEEIRFTTGDLRTTNGGITLEEPVWETLTAQTTNGTIRITEANIRGPETNLQTTNGGITISTTRPRRHFAYDVRSSSGSIRVGSSRYNAGRWSSPRTEGDSLIIASTVNGSIRISFDD